jgi:hypothetical protein
MVPQVPAARPFGMSQTPVQQSAPRMHTSPVEPQLDARAHAPPTQLSEQHVLPSVQALPSVVHPPATTGAHMLPAQFPEQHCAFCEQAEPFCVQAAAPHEPFVQSRLQHWAADWQLVPVAPHIPITH